MKRENVYIVRFACDRDYIDEVKERVTKLAKALGALQELDFNSHEFKTHSAREFTMFNEELYKLLSEEKIFEITTHCF